MSPKVIVRSLSGQFRLLRGSIVGKFKSGPEVAFDLKKTIGLECERLGFRSIGYTMKEDFLFEVETPLGFTIRCTRSYWEFIITDKHPALAGREKEVIEALTHPDEIRVSK